MLFTKMLKLGLVLVFLTGTVAFAQADTGPVEMVFYSDLSLDIPFQDVYIETTDGMVKRPEPSDPLSSLFQPVYSVPFNNPADIFVPPFDAGPYKMGDPLGFTLSDWLAARGTGTYTVSGDRANLAVAFKNLVPKGVYTLWCVETNMTTYNMVDDPCGALNGSENSCAADEKGNASFTLEMDALPPSTPEKIYTVGLAYHSDGHTHGAEPGEFGHNVHVQLVYDFLPPAS